MRELGLVHGRRVNHNGRDWYVTGAKEGIVELERPGERPMSPLEFRRLNGDRVPKIGEDVNVQRSSGVIEKWRVIEVDPLTDQLRLRKEGAYKESIPLERLVGENPELTRRSGFELSKVMADPRSKVHVDCRWTDGNSGHSLFVGRVEGPNGEQVKVMIHEKSYGDRQQVRATKDLAAQTLAHRLGTPELFPVTVVRDERLVQQFVGKEGENLHEFLYNMTGEFSELKEKYKDLDDRVFAMMDKLDSGTRTELARGVAFSVLLGDRDQHGMNFLVERTGPNRGDFKVVRIDTDYAFSKEKAPQMDQAGNYGGSINGLFRYFSGKQLPAEVRAELKKVHEELNPADARKREASREKFAKETKLSREQVDALAERVERLFVDGKFPVSRGVREQDRGATQRIGEEIRTLKSAGDGGDRDTTDSEATEDVIESFVSKNDIDGLTTYLKNLSEEDLSALEYGIEVLYDLEREDKVVDLAKGKTEAGRCALEYLLSRGKVEAKPGLKESLRSGELVDDIVRRQISLDSLVSYTGIDTNDLVTKLLKSADTTQQRHELCRRILELELPRDRRSPAAETIVAWQGEAAAEFAKSGESGQKELFKTALKGNVVAAEAWRKTLESNPGYKLEHATRKPVSDDAVLRFHDSASRVAKQFGVAPEQQKAHATFAKELSSLRMEISKAYGPGALMLAATTGELFRDPEKTRKELANKPDILAQYEKLLPHYAEYQATDHKLEIARKQLEPAIQTLAKENGLPLPEVGRRLSGSKGQYIPGGLISVHDAYLTTSGMVSADFANTVVHELVHMEHEVARIRYVMDLAGLARPVDWNQMKRFRQKYQELYPTNPGIPWHLAEEIIKEWDGAPLTPAERIRAERLMVEYALNESRRGAKNELTAQCDKYNWFSQKLKGAKNATEVKSAIQPGLTDDYRGIARASKLVPGAFSESEVKRAIDAVLDHCNRGSDFDNCPGATGMSHFSANKPAVIDFLQYELGLYRAWSQLRDFSSRVMRGSGFVLFTVNALAWIENLPVEFRPHMIHSGNRNQPRRATPEEPANQLHLWTCCFLWIE
jgi:hypothetical protein